MKKMLVVLWALLSVVSRAQDKPNVILIYADDLGYGDLSCYGATRLRTPNLDQLAAQGLRFTDGHCTSATCTPSRYGLLTGQYPWRRSGTGVLPGDAALIIPPGTLTLPALFQKAGYRTAIVGKWHLGLGDAVEKNWNGPLQPGPNNIGFDYSFIFPATADRVPTVFVENQQVVGGDAADPIEVNYRQKVGQDPTGREHPEWLKMRSSPGQGHDGTIVNGIGRIGYMSGGMKARWTDEEVPLTFLEKARAFLSANRNRPFFLYYALTEPHVPRMPSTVFKNKSVLGYRGDAILQLDWAVGELLREVEQLGLTKKTIILFSSDNGPVLDDGYQDEAVSRLSGHRPAGVLRGGKYSAFEGGTRVPWIVRWPGKIKPGVSPALVCQVDLVASFAQLLHLPLVPGEAPDSKNVLPALLGQSPAGREVLVQQGGALSLVSGRWKYIEPSKGAAFNALVGIETGSDPQPQLYDLKNDPGEQHNLAGRYPDKVRALADLLGQIRAAGRSR